MLMADHIVRLYKSPIKIEREAIRSFELAESHTFEQTFQRRIDHLKSLAGGLLDSRAGATTNSRGQVGPKPTRKIGMDKAVSLETDAELID